MPPNLLHTNFSTSFLLSTNLLPRFTPLFLRLYVVYLQSVQWFYYVREFLTYVLHLPRLTCKPALQCLTWWLMNLFVIAMWVAILLSCSRLYVVNSRILSNEIIFKGSCPLVVCANMGLVLCPVPSDNYTINLFKVLFKYFLRYFISLLILYSFSVVLVWVIVNVY